MWEKLPRECLKSWSLSSESTDIYPTPPHNILLYPLTTSLSNSLHWVDLGPCVGDNVSKKICVCTPWITIKKKVKIWHTNRTYIVKWRNSEASCLFWVTVSIDPDWISTFIRQVLLTVTRYLMRIIDHFHFWPGIVFYLSPTFDQVWFVA